MSIALPKCGQCKNRSISRIHGIWCPTCRRYLGKDNMPVHPDIRK